MSKKQNQKLARTKALINKIEALRQGLPSGVLKDVLAKLTQESADLASRIGRARQRR